MLQQSAEPCDIQLPGYTLQKKIGSGGYGEVWLADAPGGLTKAVKIVFGFHNEKRASRELHSLEKIKSARHPFLLSLESIQVIDGRLVIVSELADNSLRERFEECCGAGLPGIPREELLGYIREAGDALDYLRDKHSLQHLDIKPENLLLVSGHVKVGDFGLVKKIQDTQVSMVGGLTPTYSAPEVFQGEPSLHSDQYSLAVLYQQMVTGQLPFSGTSAAELTLQHIHDEPDLGPLALGDRYVLAQALSKTPDQRFASCSEFVQSLAQAETAATPEAPTPKQPVVQPGFGGAKKVGSAQPSTPTVLFEEIMGESGREKSSILVDTLPHHEAKADRLAPLNLVPQGFQPTPCLILGVGGTAGEVCRQLRSKLARTFGKEGQIPSVQFLTLDSDRRALSNLTHGIDGATLTSDETVFLPLRRPQEYRESSGAICQWLSRRWLYNIPKSLLCEGLRPLGRLAFVDNARRCVQRIRTSLMRAMEEDALAESDALTQLKFRNQGVRVYVVASVSGGSGSGMALDVGYAIKTLLEKMEIAETAITGVFLHSTGQGSRHRDLARVNAHAWLRELNHFQGPHGFYPGDESCGIPAHPEGAKAFEQTYFLHLGDNLDDAQFREASAQVADFLYLDALTPAQRFFQRSQNVSNDPQSPWADVRSFGIHRCSPVSRQTLELLAQELCQSVIRAWSGDLGAVDLVKPAVAKSPSNQDTDHLVCGMAPLISQLQIQFEGLAAKAREMAERQFGKCPETLLRNLLERLANSGSPATPEEVFKLINGFFAAPAELEDSQGEFIMEHPLEALVRPLEMKLCSAVQQWLLDRLNDPQERLEGALRGCEWFSKHFDRVQDAAQKMTQILNRQVAETIAEYSGGEQLRAELPCVIETHTLAVKFFRVKLDRFASQAALYLARSMQSDLRSVQESLVEFGRQLSYFAERSNTDSKDTAGMNCHSVPSDREVSATIRSKLGELVQAVDKELQDSYLRQHGGLFEAIMGNHRELNALLDKLREVCQRRIDGIANNLMLQSLQGQPCTAGVAEAYAQGEERAASLARPQVLDVGGVANTLAIVPHESLSEADAERCRELFGEQTSLLPLAHTETILCCEAGAIPLPHLALSLIGRRRDFVEYSARVQTRNDISWNSILQFLSTMPESVGDSCTLIVSSNTKPTAPS